MLYYLIETLAAESREIAGTSTLGIVAASWIDMSGQRSLRGNWGERSRQSRATNIVTLRVIRTTLVNISATSIIDGVW